jgi:hypothetical protein
MAGTILEYLAHARVTAVVVAIISGYILYNAAVVSLAMSSMFRLVDVRAENPRSLLHTVA